MRKRMVAGLAVLVWLFGLLAPMGAMAVPPVTGVTVIKRTVFGDMVVVFAKANLPASYSGATITAKSLGMGNIQILQVITPVTMGGYTVTWDPDSVTDATLHAFVGTAGGSFTFTGDPVTPTFSGNSSTLTGVISPPTFTVKNGTIGSNMGTGLTADSAAANFVGGTGITADRTLGASSPVGTPSLTMDAYAPTGTIGTFTPTGTVGGSGGGGALSEVTASTDLSAEEVVFVAYGT